MHVGKNIKIIRMLRGIERVDLAEGLCICERQLVNIENGKTKVDTDRLLKVAKLLNVESRILLELDVDTLLNSIKKDH